MWYSIFSSISHSVHILGRIAICSEKLLSPAFQTAYGNPTFTLETFSSSDATKVRLSARFLSRREISSLLPQLYQTVQSHLQFHILTVHQGLIMPNLPKNEFLFFPFSAPNLSNYPFLLVLSIFFAFFFLFVSSP